MQHARLVVHRLHFDGQELPVRLATLVAVRRDESAAGDGGGVDWEVVADGVEPYGGELGRYHVEMLCIVGADPEGHLILGELEGDAVVVRFVERTVVLRGDGPLTGLTPDMFEG